jgi:hypothetical protein
MNPLALLIVTLLINGQPASDPISLYATTEDCQAEMATVNGMNMAFGNTGMSYLARCEPAASGNR